MKLYLIYPNQFAVGTKPIGISMLAAVLKAAGHQFRLFDTTQFSVDAAETNNDMGTARIEYKRVDNPERLPAKRDVTSSQLLDILIDDIRAYGPDVIGLSVLTDDYALGLLMLRRAKATFRDVPTLVGGIQPTIDPEGVIAESCVDAICVGEGEEVLLDVAEAVDGGRGWHEIRNLWVKDRGRITRNALRPLIPDLNGLPYLDWSIYPDHAFYKPYMGHVYRYGDFLLARGCLYKCSYCINVHLHGLYGMQGFHREKSLERAVTEMKWLKERWGLEFVKFWDETFLMMSEPRLEELVEMYLAEVGLPFIIETTAESINARTAKLLAKMGCQSASVGMETGNADMRKKVLVKPTPDVKYERAFGLLREHGIRACSFNMLGLPFETREGLLNTIRLNKRFGTDAQSVGTFFPYKGTPLREKCVEWGLLDPVEQERWERDYSVNRVSLTRGQSILKNPQLPREDYLHIRDNFSLYVELPESLRPLVDLCADFGETVTRLRSILMDIAYRRRFEGLKLYDNIESSLAPAEAATSGELDTGGEGRVVVSLPVLPSAGAGPRP